MTIQLIRPDWPLTHLNVGTTTRAGGFSTAPYASLNLAQHVADDPTIVTRNRDFLQQTLGLPCPPCWINQTHSTVVIGLEDWQPNAPGDGVYSKNPAKVGAILTADCLPIVIANSHQFEYTLIHAGWRGLANGIIDAACQQFTTQPSHYCAWLGPAISQPHFEVGEEVYQAFVSKSVDYKTGFTAQRTPNKWLADMYQLAKINLAQLGIHRVYGGDYCTYRDSADFFSYRREGGVCGRMATLVWAK